MIHNEFVQALGFESYEALIRASESIIKEGNVDWFITQLPNGRWAAWDDAELLFDRVMYFATRGEAVAFHLGAYAEKYREK